MTAEAVDVGVPVSGVDVPIGDGLHIRLHVAGEGAPVVMVHGAGTGALGVAHFRANIRAFVAAGYQVIVPDLLGFGGSSKPIDATGYPLERLTDTLAKALTVHGVAQAAFLGNSLGGAISIDMALRWPERVSRAVLLAPGALESREVYMALPAVQAMGAFAAGGINPTLMRAMLESFVSDPAVVHDDVVAARVAAARAQPAEVTMTMRLPDLTPRLAGLDLPLLVIWGGADGICPPASALKFATACRDATVILYAGVGHWPMAERADEVNRAGLDFLKG